MEKEFSIATFYAMKVNEQDEIAPLVNVDRQAWFFSVFSERRTKPKKRRKWQDVQETFNRRSR